MGDPGSNPIEPIVKAFSKLPGVGEKTAQRYAFHLLTMPTSEVSSFSSVLTQVRSRIQYCSTCYNIALSDTCWICDDDSRSRDLLCVVAEPKEILALERDLRVFINDLSRPTSQE